MTNDMQEIFQFEPIKILQKYPYYDILLSVENKVQTLKY